MIKTISLPGAKSKSKSCGFGRNLRGGAVEIGSGAAIEIDICDVSVEKKIFSAEAESEISLVLSEILGWGARSEIAAWGRQ